MSDYELSRREFLQVGSTAGAAALLGPGLRAADEPKKLKPTADASSSSGWPAAWPPPRRSTPSATRPSSVGMPAEEILCTFPSIDTAVDNIKHLRRGCEHIAQVMDRGTLIRSSRRRRPGNILHSRHQYHWHTGYVPPQTWPRPHIGAVDRPHPRAATTRPSRRSSTSASGSTGRRGRGAQGVSRPAGFLGSEYGPFTRRPSRRRRSAPSARRPA